MTYWLPLGRVRASLQSAGHHDVAIAWAEGGDGRTVRAVGVGSNKKKRRRGAQLALVLAVARRCLEGDGDTLVIVHWFIVDGQSCISMSHCWLISWPITEFNPFSGQVLHGAPRAELGRKVMSRLPLCVRSRRQGLPRKEVSGGAAGSQQHRLGHLEWRPDAHG